MRAVKKFFPLKAAQFEHAEPASASARLRLCERDQPPFVFRMRGRSCRRAKAPWNPCLWRPERSAWPNGSATGTASRPVRPGLFRRCPNPESFGLVSSERSLRQAEEFCVQSCDDSGLQFCAWLTPSGCAAPPLPLSCAPVNRLTKQEQLVLCIVLGLLLTGWAVKAWRTARTPAAPSVSVTH